MKRSIDVESELKGEYTTTPNVESSWTASAASLATITGLRTGTYSVRIWETGSLKPSSSVTAAVPAPEAPAITDHPTVIADRRRHFV